MYKSVLAFLASGVGVPANEAGLSENQPHFGEIRDRLWENLPSTSILGKSVEVRHRFCHRLWRNLPQTLGKSVADFGEICHRLWENPSRILGKSVADFGEISHRLWDNQPPILGKSATDFGEKLALF